METKGQADGFKSGFSNLESKSWEGCRFSFPLQVLMTDLGLQDSRAGGGRSHIHHSQDGQLQKSPDTFSGR
jgi:hypothetical protein